jgi:PQQ-dependent dehydrogenase (methanol/ethanol family)
MGKRLGVAIATAILLLAGCNKAVSPVDATRIINADKTPGDWLTNGRTYSEQRFSPLDKVNRDTVANLGLAWSFDLPEERGIEATPIVADGVMYTTSSWSVVRAFDARTGKLLWTYDPKVARATDVKACCDAVNRGVALWKGEVYVGTLDGRLEALDAKTGKRLWSTVTVDQSKPYTITGAPRVIKDKVLIGNGGAELGVRGYISAYDADTGKLAWRFYTVPGPSARDGAASDNMLDAMRATWPGAKFEEGGGGTVWDSMAYDPDLDLLYIGVGNGSPWNREVRSPGGGDNLFLSSIVALKPETGQYVWHYQTTPGESWDYTATQHIILADINVGGAIRKVLMQAPKNGFFYLIDRTNGKLISARNYVPTTWATGIDANGRPIETPNARYTSGVSLASPGPLGGHNWQPMAFSPQTGLVYIPAQEIPFPYMQPGGANANYKYRAGGWNLGVDSLIAALPDDEAQLKAIRASLKGRLIAWDPIAQAPRWSVPYEGPWNGGVLATGGGLVFQGNATGEFAAYDAANGKKLWSYATQTGVVAPPMTYEIDGEQYVALEAGWGGAFSTTAGAGVDPRSNGVRRILVFKLGAKGKLPEPPASVPHEFTDLPPVTGTPADVDAGKLAFANNCSVCHGASAVSEFSIPDLRYSAVTHDAADWKSVVIDGQRKERGMVSFAAFLTPDQAEQIRQYVLSVANVQKARMAAAAGAK